MKRFMIDTNFNWLGPSKPALSHEEARRLGLQENERVTVYQDDDEWEALVKYDDSLPYQYKWYVILQD
jgi:anaerobic selenocysteine-containing dehydrogenase